MKLTIPFYLHKAGAGFPSPATDYIEEDIDLNVHLIKNVPATFVIRVQGKSMADVGINDGDILVVDKSLSPKNFSTVIANVHDELVVKSFEQIYKESGDKLHIKDKAVFIEHVKGYVGLGEVSILIAVACPHRVEAYDLSRYIIEEIKKRSPIWKKEHYENESSEWLKGNPIQTN